MLSQSVDVEDADDEVADMMGRRSELAELGRVEDAGEILVPAVPAEIFSLLTLLGREEEG